MCKRAAEMLGMKFKMKANGSKICESDVTNEGKLEDDFIELVIAIP